MKSNRWTRRKSNKKRSLEKSWKRRNRMRKMKRMKIKMRGITMKM